MPHCTFPSFYPLYHTTFAPSVASIFSAFFDEFSFFRKRLHLPDIRYFVGFSCRASLFLQITRLCDVSQFLHIIFRRKMM